MASNSGVLGRVAIARLPATFVDATRRARKEDCKVRDVVREETEARDNRYGIRRDMVPEMFALDATPILIDRRSMYTTLSLSTL